MKQIILLLIMIGSITQVYTNTNINQPSPGAILIESAAIATALALKPYLPCTTKIFRY